MVFSSFSFLFFFFPSVLILYFIYSGRAYRNAVLLLGSLFFYAWGEPLYVLLMGYMILFNWIIGKHLRGAKKKWVFLLGILHNLGILAFFKYSNFFLEILSQVSGYSLGRWDISLPIGISFYTFQILSYLIDIYRGELEAQRNPFYFGMYVALFPQLIAGPIVRYADIEKEINHRQESLTDAAAGFRRFFFGLGKKVILANSVGIIAERVFAAESLRFTGAWLGIVAYGLQIYFDFSAYSDMAIGLGRVFGFHFLENFNYPYMAVSVTDFWRRWHMSLSQWFRDYVYIPLGGNRQGRVRQLGNLLIVWLLTGLWHGAAYNFVFWGLWFFIFLIIEKMFLGRLLQKLPIINRFYTLLVVLGGWVIFAHNTPEAIMKVFRALGAWEIPNLSIFEELGVLPQLPFFLSALLLCTPIYPFLEQKLKDREFGNFFLDFSALAVLLLSVFFLVNNSYNPFIYFRF